MDYPFGAVAVTTYGQLTMETTQSLLESRAYCEANKIRAGWLFVPGSLVDRARNEAVRQFLAHQPKMEWLLFVDGDCQFEPHAIHQLLKFAYEEHPGCDIVGAYNNLRGDPYLPTIDTGTGTWESHLPNMGPVEVMRTGSAFILIKRHVYEGMEAPWYGTRNPMRPVDALAEVDNYALQKFDGKNPLRNYPEWDLLWKCAKDESSTYRRHDGTAFVGEDSNFCDRARALGYSIWVHTDVANGHVDRKLITALDHQRAMDERDTRRKQAVGVLR